MPIFLFYNYIVNKYPMTKNKPIYHVEDKQINERLRFHRDLSMDLRSERDKSFIVGHWVLIYFITQSLLKIKKQKTYLVFLLLKRDSRQSAVLFILSTAAAILTKTYLITSPFFNPFCCKNELKLSFLFVYAASFQNGTR